MRWNKYDANAVVKILIDSKQNHNKLTHKQNLKIFNFPTLSWQPNRITTSRTTKKMKTFSIIFSLLGFIVKKQKTKENFIFFQLYHTFSVTKHNHTTKYNHKTYRKDNGCLRSAFHFLSIGVDVRSSTPSSVCGEMGFQVEDKMSFEAEKRRKRWGHGFARLFN